LCFELRLPKGCSSKVTERHFGILNFFLVASSLEVGREENGTSRVGKHSQKWVIELEICSFLSVTLLSMLFYPYGPNFSLIHQFL
jgi:hypothetical protein